MAEERGKGKGGDLTNYLGKMIKECGENSCMGGLGGRKVLRSFGFNSSNRIKNWPL